MRSKVRITSFICHSFMKKILFAISFLLIASHLQAQDTLLIRRIREANSKVTSLETHLHNHNKKNGNVTEKEGTLYFSSPDKFAATFDNGTYMIVNGNRIKVNVGIFHGKFKMRNGLARSLTNAFLYAFQGRCQDIADENNYSIETESDQQFHNIILTTKKKSFFGIGIKQAIFRFDLESLLIKEIKLIDFRDNTDTYTVSDPIYNGDIDEKNFDT